MADLYFIETGYFDPELGYYVYTADAESAFAISSSVSCDATKIATPIEGSATLVCEFTNSTSAGKLIDADIEAITLFDISVLATAQLAGTALLEATFAIIPTAVVNRSITQTLDNIITLNAQAAKVAVIDSTMATAATLTAAATKLKVSSAALSANSSISTTQYFGTGRPRNLSGTAYYDTSNKKFGTASVYADGSLLFAGGTTRPDTSDDWVLETWIYHNGSETTNIWTYWLNLDINASEQIVLNLYNSSGSSAVSFTSNSGVVATNTWKHILVVKDSGRISLFYDGSRIFTTTSLPTSYYKGPSYAVQIVPGSSSRLDETSLWVGTTLNYNPSSSTITVPSSARSNDPATTQFLYHFNSNALDDIIYTASAQAALSSQASLSAVATKTQGETTASLAATSSLTALVGKLIEVSSAQTAEFAQSVDTSKVLSGLADLTTSSELSATAYVLRTADIASSAEFAENIDYNRIREFAADTLVLFTPSMVVNAQLAGTALLESTSELTAVAYLTRDAVSTESAEFTQSAEITRTRNIAGALTIDSAVTAELNKVLNAEASVTSEFTQTADIDLLPGAVIAVSSEFTQSITATRIQAISSDLTAQTSLFADIGLVRPGSSALASEFTTDIIAYKTTDADSALSAESQVTAEVNSIPGIDADLTVESTLTLVASITTDSLVEAIAMASEVTIAYKNASGTISCEATTTLSAALGKIIVLTPNYNTGARSSDGLYPRIQLSGLPVGGLDIYSSGFTASIWAKREVVGNYLQTIWTPQITGQSYYTGLVIDNNNIRLRSTFDSDEPGATWANQAPTDTDWHHYLIQCSRPGHFKLWLDGEYLGSQTYFASVQSGKFENNYWIRFGSGVPTNLYDESWTNPSGNLDPNVSVAQVWMGIVDTEYVQDPLGNYYRVTSAFDPGNFYNNGYVDLGSLGRGLANQLPEPYIYDTLSSPWTNVQFWNGSTSATGTPASSSLLTPTAQASSTLTAEPQAVLVNVIETQATTALTAQATKRVVTESTQTAEFTQTTEAVKFVGVTSDLTSEFTQSSEASRTRDVTSDLTAELGLAVISGFFEQATADLSTAFDLTADVTLIEPIRTSADLVAESSVTAEVTGYSGVAAFIAVQASLTAEITVKPPVRITADLAATSELAATIGSIEQFIVLTSSSGTMTAAAVKTAQGQSNLIVTSTQTAGPVKYTGIVANWSAFYSQLSVGDVLNIDPYLTLVIKPENRIIVIESETRALKVTAETRVLTIEGYQ